MSDNGLPIGTIVRGDSLEVMRGWPAGVVQLVVTSPPYWGLRDYRADGVSLEGQWGREPTPEAHIARLVEWAREVRRVLRPDGVMVLNYGESYYSGPGPKYDGGHGEGRPKLRAAKGSLLGVMPSIDGLAPKNLLGLPWRLAVALQADGWIWRAWCPWVKANGMPESVRDRPELSCEVMLMFAASPRYYWDQEAIRVGYSAASGARADGSQVTTGNPDVRPGFMRTLSKRPDNWDSGKGAHGSHHRDGRERGSAAVIESHGRIRKTGDWWRESVPLLIAQMEAWIAHARAFERGETPVLLDMDGLPLGQLHPTYAYPGSHFATYPPELVRPWIRAATSERGQCPACGAPWVREVAVGYTVNRKGHAGRKDAHGGNNRDGSGLPNLNRHSSTTGWHPSCACDAGEPVPQIVLDPFAGTGTTCVVAAEEGRRTVGIDLYGGDYDFGGHTAMDRLRAAMGTGPRLEHVAAERGGQTSLLESETGAQGESA